MIVMIRHNYVQINHCSENYSRQETTRLMDVLLSNLGVEGTNTSSSLSSGPISDWYCEG